jgi:shikimate dehydrogenase
MTSHSPYAEVIGDPVAQSKSPLIHVHWLEQLGLEGHYGRTLVTSSELGSFLELRRSDPHWRGCNVTIPHKERILDYLDSIDERSSMIGAVNCIVCKEGRLAGYNTDIDGVAEALRSADLEGRTAVLIGAGGAARAAAAYLADRSLSRLHILVRDPKRAEGLRQLLPGTKVEIAPLASLATIASSPVVVINASPLGMSGKPPMPAEFLASLSNIASSALFFDMVYDPLETAFLETGRVAGARTVDGLTMLIGQARRAFELFFGTPAPQNDQSLCDLLVT